MQISELALQADVTVSTIKYYLREGLLPAGTSRGVTRSDYDEAHLTRLRLIRALVEIAGLPLAQVKRILALIDEPREDLFDTLGQALSALPPYPAEPALAGAGQFPLARAAIGELGWWYDSEYPATAQLDRALAGARDADIPVSPQRLAVYGEALRMLSEFDLSEMPKYTRSNPTAAITYVVLGTALHEPVLMSMRRLAHMDAAARSLGPHPGR